jgi:hypothetical protein
MASTTLRYSRVNRKRDSIEAHLTIVFAALAVTRFIEDRTDRSIKKFVRTAPAATALSRSAQATTSSPPKTRYRPTCATSSASSSNPTEMRTSLTKVRRRHSCGRPWSGKWQVTRCGTRRGMLTSW